MLSTCLPSESSDTIRLHKRFKVLELWPGKIPTKSNWAGSRKWLLITLGAQSDMKYYKRTKDNINQGQSLAGWEIKLFYGMKGINILRVMIILPQSCWLELKRKPGACCDRIHFIIQFPLGLFLSVNIFSDLAGKKWENTHFQVINIWRA